MDKQTNGYDPEITRELIAELYKYEAPSHSVWERAETACIEGYVEGYFMDEGVLGKAGACWDECGGVPAWESLGEIGRHRVLVRCAYDHVTADFDLAWECGAFARRMEKCLGDLAALSTEEGHE